MIEHFTAPTERTRRKAQPQRTQRYAEEKHSWRCLIFRLNIVRLCRAVDLIWLKFSVGLCVLCGCAFSLIGRGFLPSLQFLLLLSDEPGNAPPPTCLADGGDRKTTRQSFRPDTLLPDLILRLRLRLRRVPERGHSRSGDRRRLAGMERRSRACQQR